MDKLACLLCPITLLEKINPDWHDLWLVLVCGFLAALRFAIHGNWIPAFPAGMTAIRFGGKSFGFCLGLGLRIDTS